MDADAPAPTYRFTHYKYNQTTTMYTTLNPPHAAVAMSRIEEKHLNHPHPISHFRSVLIQFLDELFNLRNVLIAARQNMYIYVSRPPEQHRSYFVILLRLEYYIHCIASVWFSVQCFCLHE